MKPFDLVRGWFKESFCVKAHKYDKVAGIWRKNRQIRFNYMNL
jgi:hypothetical protein